MIEINKLKFLKRLLRNILYLPNRNLIRYNPNDLHDDYFMKHIEEEEYQKIIKSMPIFCLDFLISFEKKYLLIKRNEEPLKNLYWIIGGRLMFKETIKDAAIRIQKREIGISFSNFKIIGFSNYFFTNKPNSRALHTPSLLFHISVNKIFNPKLDKQHNNFIWSDNIPEKLIKQTTFFETSNIVQNA